MICSPVSAYTAIKNPNTKCIRIYYNDPKIQDEERIYTFKPDGSASVQSCAWGNKSECPVGTFFNLILNLANVEQLNSQVARDMAMAYDKFARENGDKLKITWANKY